MPAATTGANGAYSISNIQAGKYVFCEVAQTGWLQSAPANTICSAGTGLAPGGHAETIAVGGTIPGNDFGNYRNATKTGTKFEDSNANGAKDTGEPGVVGVEIRAYADANGDGVTDDRRDVRQHDDRDGRGLQLHPQARELRRLRGPPGRLDPELPNGDRRVHADRSRC